MGRTRRNPIHNFLPPHLNPSSVHPPHSQTQKAQISAKTAIYRFKIRGLSPLHSFPCVKPHSRCYATFYTWILYHIPHGTHNSRRAPEQPAAAIRRLHAKPRQTCIFKGVSPPNSDSSRLPDAARQEPTSRTSGPTMSQKQASVYR